MARKRRTFSSKFKARVALAAIRGDRTISQLCTQFGVSGNQISAWKRQLLEGAGDLFQDGRKRKEPDGDSPVELYEQIGRLKMELEWLKKKSAEFD